MAGLTSVLGVLPVIQQGVGLAAQIAGQRDSGAQQRRAQEQALADLQRRQDEQQRQNAENNALERQRLALDSGEAERRRRDALKRAVARQRADFAGQGLSARGGSAEAVLLGLFTESEAEKMDRERLDSLRRASLELSTEQQGRLNVIQRTDAQERARLNRLASQEDRRFDTVNNVLGAGRVLGGLF